MVVVCPVLSLSRAVVVELECGIFYSVPCITRFRDCEHGLHILVTCAIFAQLHAKVHLCAVLLPLCPQMVQLNWCVLAMVLSVWPDWRPEKAIAGALVAPEVSLSICAFCIPLHIYTFNTSWRRASLEGREGKSRRMSGVWGGSPAKIEAGMPKISMFELPAQEVAKPSAAAAARPEGGGIKKGVKFAGAEKVGGSLVVPVVGWEWMGAAGPWMLGWA
eukprot:scaffold79140_cov22-Tisochrysis_lutea.AAC.1